MGNNFINGGVRLISKSELVIRPVTIEDLPSLWQLAYKDESPEWKKWDAPYF